MDLKTCKDCQVAQPLENFTKQSRSKDGRYTYCKPCARARVKASVGKRLRGELPVLAVTYKKCCRCGETKAASEFNINRSRRDGLTSRCIRCEASNRLRLKYGMSQAAYDEQSAAQNGRCLICKTTTFLVVDHCHTTGRVRGLICQPCNRGLGDFKDDPARLLAAVAYLARI